jgi:hypothetical protein
VRALALESSPIGHANTLESPEAGSTPLDSAAVGEACSHSSAGLDAWASLLRLEEAERQLPAGSRVELATLRRNVFAHLPAELR